MLAGNTSDPFALSTAVVLFVFASDIAVVNADLSIDDVAGNTAVITPVSAS